MAKNFSVAWLSQSSQPQCRSDLDVALVHRPVASAVQTKPASLTGCLLSDDKVKDDTKIPSSPTSKHSNSNTMVTFDLCGLENVSVIGFAINVLFFIFFFFR